MFYFGSLSPVYRYYYHLCYYYYPNYCYRKKVGLDDDASGRTARNAEEDERRYSNLEQRGTANDGTDRGRMTTTKR